MSSGPACRRRNDLAVRKMATWINLALVLVLGGVIVKSTLLRDEPEVAPAVSPTTDDGTPSETSDPMPSDGQKNYENIVERNLFTDAYPGKNESNHTIPPLAAQLNLTLQGTVAGASDIARAIISDLSAHTTDLYKTGDTIAKARIIEIKRGAVILLCEGRSLILRLNANETITAPNTENNSTAANATVNAQEEREQWQIRNDFINELLDAARIEPYIVDGQTQGLRIVNLDQAQTAELIGLKSGDIIRMVNGQKLTGKQKAFQVFRKARTQPSLNIEILRGDTVKTVSFNLN